jgi:hypothetical protein
MNAPTTLVIRSRSIGLCALVLTVLAGTAPAGLVDNSANGDQFAGGVSGWSRLDPWRAQFMPAGSCPWLQPALDAQGYRQIRPGVDNPATIGDGRWTINRLSLAGNLYLDTYKAFVDTAPRVNIDNFTVYQPTAVPGMGGAAFGLRYVPGNGDPTTGLHWIQVIRTNVPLNGGDDPGAYQIYLDNAMNAGVSPWYDFPGATSPTGTRTNADGSLRDFWMADRPRRNIRNGVDWEAQAFLATWDPGREIINLYDGVWWGWWRLGSHTRGRRRRS